MINNKWFYELFVLVLGLSLPLEAQVVGGRIQGVVVSELGVAVGDARVTYRQSDTAHASPSRNPFGFRSQPPIVRGGIVETDESGAFEIVNLESGKYFLCAEFSPKAPYLDGCSWGQPVTSVVLDSGAVTNVNITAKQASVLEVRVDDPSGLVKASPIGGNMTVGVFSDENRWFYGARPSDRVGQSVTFSLRIPRDHLLRLSVDSSNLDYELRDDPTRDPSSVRFSAPESGIPLTYDIRIIGPNVPASR